MMARPDTRIETWDTQVYSRAIIEGIFAAKTAESNVDRLRYRKGYMYETRSIRNIDERSAGFIDWVGKYGTPFDKACLGSAVIRCSLMGRLHQWHSNIEGLWKRFVRSREKMAQWINQPGEFVHHEGSFFAPDLFPGDRSYDLMQVDPPKIVVGADVYSTNFQHFNRALGGSETELPKWNWRDSMGAFRRVLEVDAQRILFMYVSGVRPPYEEVIALLEETGKVEQVQEFPHRSRTDYGIVVKRG
jgi:hypothetical protein